MSDTSVYKKVVDRIFYEMWNQQRVDLVDELFAPHFEVHYSVHCVTSHTDFRNMLRQWFVGIPDLKHTIDDVMCDGNKVIVHWHGEGTHKGLFLDIPPTQKPFYYGGITIFELTAELKIKKAWVYNDLTDMSLQLRA